MILDGLELCGEGERNSTQEGNIVLKQTIILAYEYTWKKMKKGKKMGKKCLSPMEASFYTENIFDCHKVQIYLM